MQQAWATYQETVVENPWIPKLPWPRPVDGEHGCGPFPRQQLFLMHTHTPEVLFGGAAGGSKSWALLMAAAQYVQRPNYHALLLRSSFPDLMQAGALIPTSKEWWYDKPIDGQKAKWNQQDRRWTFPSGATITFGYLEHDDDVYQYQGAAFPFIGFDELTQHAENNYRYLFSRLRREATSDIPLRMRATANPGGRGHEWVKARFLTEAEPGRVFIASKLADNPGLDTEEYIKSLSHLDPITRDQLLHGDWEAYRGGRFQREWFRYYEPLGPVGDRHTQYLFGDKRITMADIGNRFLTVDPAATVKTTAKADPDFTVISSWGTTKHGWLVWLGCRLGRWEIPDIPDAIAEEYRKWDATLAIIEGIGVGKGTAQLTRRHAAHLNVVEIKSVPEKLTNAANAMNMAEAGRIWLPKARCGLDFPTEDVESQVFRFTGNPKKDGHDDIVDTLSNACNRIMSREPLQRTTAGLGIQIARQGPAESWPKQRTGPWKKKWKLD